MAHNVVRNFVQFQTASSLFLSTYYNSFRAPTSSAELRLRNPARTLLSLHVSTAHLPVRTCKRERSLADSYADQMTHGRRGPFLLAVQYSDVVTTANAHHLHS